MQDEKGKRKVCTCRMRKEKERLHFQGEKGSHFQGGKEKERLHLEGEKGKKKDYTCRMRKEKERFTLAG